jgi:hypothetical protein
MPPKRKVASSQPAGAKKAKSTASNAATDDATSPEVDALVKAKHASRSKRWAAVSGSKNLDAEYFTKMIKDADKAYEFTCVCNPLGSQGDEDEDEWDDVDDEDEDEDDEDADEDVEMQHDEAKGTGQKCDRGKTCPCTKPASEIPSHPYTFTSAALAKYHMASDMAMLRNPDAFDMYTFNDHSAYGALEVVQNLIFDFNEANVAGDWQEAWTVVQALGLFLQKGEGLDMSLADDGEQISKTAVLVAKMALTSLAMLENGGHLEDPAVKTNAAWIVALYLAVTRSFRDMGLLEDEPSGGKFKFDPDHVDRYLAAYATRLGLDVPDRRDWPEDETTEMPQTTTATAASDPWGWKTAYNKYSKESSSHPASSGGIKPGIGGDSLDISTWTSAQRKAASFDKKDPLPRDTVNKLKQGLVLSQG